MKVIEARNVHQMLAIGIVVINSEGQMRDSRNGAVMVMNTPVTSVYDKPEERVLFHKGRDANPFFHFMEGLWMLAGRNDLDWISQFNSNMANYSDDGETFHGAYGHRWRQHFKVNKPNGKPIDQLLTNIKLLRENRDDRRVVMSMWDPSCDLGMDGKDFPCNLIITFRVNSYGKLDMTVFNRSNDIVWGAYGANAVHMSMMQEVVASAIGVPIGRYWQISTNFHLYQNLYETQDLTDPFGWDLDQNPYHTGEVKHYPMMTIDSARWFQDLAMFIEEGPVMGFRDPFFKNVAIPMFMAWKAWKDKDNPKREENTLKYLDGCLATDWRKACKEWVLRRCTKLKE